MNRDDFKAKMLYRVLDGSLSLDAARKEIIKYEKVVME